MNLCQAHIRSVRIGAIYAAKKRQNYLPFMTPTRQYGMAVYLSAEFGEFQELVAVLEKGSRNYFLPIYTSHGGAGRLIHAAQVSTEFVYEFKPAQNCISAKFLYYEDYTIASHIGVIVRQKNMTNEDRNVVYPVSFGHGIYPILTEIVIEPEEPIIVHELKVREET